MTDMRSPVLLSVNVGLPRDVPWQGKTVHTGIYKEPVADWIQAKAKDRMTEVLRAQPSIDVVYGHNDPMAIGAYLAAKELGRDKEMIFVGVDGLGGPAGGIKKVVDGVLAATFVYPLCVDKTVEIGLKMLRVTKELSAKHYAEHVTKSFYPLLEEFITSGPVVALVAEGPQAVAVVRGMMGPTNGAQATPGTIRGDFGVSRQMNLMHGSDSVEAAAKEIAVYFKPDELISYESTLAGWVCAADEAK